MSGGSRALQWSVWGALLVVILVITALFVQSKIEERPLPVLGEIADFSLTNQHGAVISLKDLKGSVWVADIIFSRCPGPCIKMTRQMAEIAKLLPGGRPVKLVSLTADPKYDTPPVLSEYAKRFGAAAENWWFLTGPKETIYHLSVGSLLLAVSENPAEDAKNIEDVFIHSTRFALVDKKGRLRSLEFDGEDPETPRRVAAAVRQLEKER